MYCIPKSVLTTLARSFVDAHGVVKKPKPPKCTFPTDAGEGDSLPCLSSYCKGST